MGEALIGGPPDRVGDGRALERGEQERGQTAQRGKIGRHVAGADLASVLGEDGIANVVMRLDRPVAAHQRA